MIPSHVVYPENWTELSRKEQERLRTMYRNHTVLCELGLDTGPRTYLDAADPRAGGKQKTSKHKRHLTAAVKKTITRQGVRVTPAFLPTGYVVLNTSKVVPRKTPTIPPRTSPTRWWGATMVGKLTLSMDAVPASLKELLSAYVDGLRKPQLDVLTGERRFKHVSHQSGSGAKDKFWGWQVQKSVGGILCRAGLVHDESEYAL